VSLKPHRGQKEKELKHRYTASERAAHEVIHAYNRQVDADFDSYDLVESSDIETEPETGMRFRTVVLFASRYRFVKVFVYQMRSDTDEDDWYGWKVEYHHLPRIGEPVYKVYHFYRVMDGFRFDKYSVSGLTFEVVQTMRRIQQEADERINELLKPYLVE
jgi:hypothetical protein